MTGIAALGGRDVVLWFAELNNIVMTGFAIKIGHSMVKKLWYPGQSAMALFTITVERNMVARHAFNNAPIVATFTTSQNG